MIKVTPIDKITVDENTELQVSECSVQVQELVQYYNDWREQEAEYRSKSLMAQQGLKSLTQEIMTVVKKELAEKAKAAEEAAAATLKADAPASASEPEPEAPANTSHNA